MQTVRQRLIELSTLSTGTFREHLTAIEQNISHTYSGSGNIKASPIVSSISVKGGVSKVRNSAVKGVVG